MVADPPIPPFKSDTLATVAASMGQVVAPKPLLVNKRGVTVGADGHFYAGAKKGIKLGTKAKLQEQGLINELKAIPFSMAHMMPRDQVVAMCARAAILLGQY